MPPTALPELTADSLRALAAAYRMADEARQHGNLLAELRQIMPTNASVELLWMVSEGKAPLNFQSLEPLLPLLNAMIRYLNAGAALGPGFVGFGKTILEMVKKIEEKK